MAEPPEWIKDAQHKFQAWAPCATVLPAWQAERQPFQAEYLEIFAVALLDDGG